VSIIDAGKPIAFSRVQSEKPSTDIKKASFTRDFVALRISPTVELSSWRKEA
jgi:hypothetical protein